MRKIAMFGGAFNPIHNGHIEMANRISECLQLDLLLLVPTGTSPHKTTALAPNKDRLCMCQMASKYIRNCVVSDIELHRAGKSYTADTLLELKKQYKDDRLYLICGADMFLTLNEWYRPDIIFENAVICGIKRDNTSDHLMQEKKRQLEAMGAEVCILDISVPPYSSTVVRESIRKGEVADDMIKSEIEDYIKKKGLYL